MRVSGVLKRDMKLSKYLMEIFAQTVLRIFFILGGIFYYWWVDFFHPTTLYLRLSHVSRFWSSCSLLKGDRISFKALVLRLIYAPTQVFGDCSICFILLSPTYEAYMTKLNDYWDGFPGSDANNKICKTKLNEIIFHIIPNGWCNQYFLPGFYFQAFHIKKTINMFEHMYIVEYIYEVLAEPSNKKLSRADTNHSSHYRKIRWRYAFLKPNIYMGSTGKHNRRCV